MVIKSGNSNQVPVYLVKNGVCFFIFFVRAEEFHGIPDKNRDFAIQFFVQTIFHFSTSLHWYIPIAQRIVDALLY